MIKKILVSLLFSATIAISYSQCTPNVSCIPAGKTYGICPDSTDGIAIGTVGVPYTQTISMMVPATGADFGYAAANISSIVIDGVDSLAPGLNYVCSPANCSFPGNSSHCIFISGTPTQVWNHQIIVNATANATIGFVPFSMPQTNKQYRSIVLASGNGIETLDLTKFSVDQNTPNPFTDNTEIRFSSVSISNVEFKVYNLLGSVVYNNKFKAEKGVNSIKVEGNLFASGVYMYSLTNGDKTITKRMIVSNK